MSSRPIPGSTGEVLTDLPSPYLPHPATGLLHLPRFIAKIKYVQAHGAMPKSYRKNYKRGFDRFLCMHLGVEPDDVERIVMESADEGERDRRLLALFPEDVQAHKWNRELVHKGMSEAGQEFLNENLDIMGCPDRKGQIKSVADMIDFDEGRID